MRFKNVHVPTGDDGNIIKHIDADIMVLGICKNKLKINLNTTDTGQSHPIGEVRDGEFSIIIRFLSYRQRQLA